MKPELELQLHARLEHLFQLVKRAARTAGVRSGFSPGYVKAADILKSDTGQPRERQRSISTLIASSNLLQTHTVLHRHASGVNGVEHRI